ncbi:MAG: CRISPR-associated endonuclease Cas2 [Thaumarchaeota archaeon]|nr:MAG: CRISPR-associated endonuclease Cas2 [Nitrososphaerota archaeon]
METLVIYDVTEDAVRNEVARICESFGLMRIQKSTFIGYLPSSRRKELMAIFRYSCFVDIAKPLEKFYRKIVRRVFIYYEKSNELVEIEIAEERKKHVLKILRKLRETLSQECLPVVNQPLVKCLNCGYRKICLP